MLLYSILFFLLRIVEHRAIVDCSQLAQPSNKYLVVLANNNNTNPGGSEPENFPNMETLPSIPYSIIVILAGLGLTVGLIWFVKFLNSKT